MLYFMGYIDGHISFSHCPANEKNSFSFSPYNGATCILSITGDVSELMFAIMFWRDVFNIYLWKAWSFCESKGSVITMNGEI